MSTSQIRSTQRGMVKTLIVALFLLLPTVAVAQTYTISPPPFLTALDNSGNVVNNACIWTYVAGTSTAVFTYIDNAGTQNANPIRSDSAGRFTAYLIPGQSYKFVYESACTPPAHGTVLRTADNISAMPTAGNNADVTGTAGEALAAGDVVYLSAVDGRWYKADSDVTTSSSTAAEVGMAPSAIASGSSGSIRLAGRVTGLSGLTAGTKYYVSATAGALTATPPTNVRELGAADTTTSLVLDGNNPGNVRMPDSNGTHSLVLTTTSNLTADRLFTLVPGDAARTVTVSGNPTIGDGTFAGGTWIATADLLISRNTSDGSDNGIVSVTGGGATGTARGGELFTHGNEAARAGDVVVAMGNVAGSEFSVARADGTEVLEIIGTDGAMVFTSSRQLLPFTFSGTNTVDTSSNIVLGISTGTVQTGTATILLNFAANGNNIGNVDMNNNAVAYNTTSDVRLKTLFGPTTRSGQVLRGIGVFDGFWNSDPERRVVQMFAAQQLHPLYPEAVRVGGADPLKDPWSVEYGRLTPLLVAGWQEHDERLNKQLDLIDGLLKRMEQLERDNAELRARLGLSVP